MIIAAAALAGMLTMHAPSGSVATEPGKQLPQSINIRVAQSDTVGDHAVHYMLFTPRAYKPDGKPWPLLLFLHGLGECGNGGDELERVKIHGPPKLVESRPDFPFVLITPQCPTPEGGLKAVPTAWKADQLMRLVDHVLANTHTDPTRVYVTGLSMGGYGTLRLAAAYPERFAAALPVCGGGEPRTMAAALRRVPIWAFHGAKDPTVPIRESQQMVDAVRCAGGCVRYTVYPEVEHDSWTATYDNPQVYDWLLSHRGPL
jgi:predicted peptidase